MREIGSFIEWEFARGRELYRGDVARLNTGRAALYHAARVLGCRTVYLPYYQCGTVREFLSRKGMELRYYAMDRDFCPQLEAVPSDAAVVLVNYFGVMGQARMQALASRYAHVILDNCQAFFAPPLPHCLNVYSARKFVGVPDGAYVVGPGAARYVEEYEQDYSSDSAAFLLQRIEYGCEGRAYAGKQANDDRLDRADIRRMSVLSHTILDGIDYEAIRQKRRQNFSCADRLLGSINRLRPLQYYADDCVPMVYPLLVENDRLLPYLLDHHILQGHWWSYLLQELPPDTAEYWLSRYGIPITIDQRYGEPELRYTADLIKECAS